MLLLNRGACDGDGLCGHGSTVSRNAREDAAEALHDTVKDGTGRCGTGCVRKERGRRTDETEGAEERVAQECSDLRAREHDVRHRRTCSRGRGGATWCEAGHDSCGEECR